MATLQVEENTAPLHNDAQEGVEEEAEVRGPS